MELDSECCPRLYFYPHSPFISANTNFLAFSQSGVDVLESDKLGTLSMTLEGCKERDRFVLQTCYEAKIPVQCSMGGGYSPDIKRIVEAHANTFRTAHEMYE